MNLTVDAYFKIRVVAHAFRRIWTASGSFWRSIHPLFMIIVFMTSDPPRGRNNFSKFSDPPKMPKSIFSSADQMVLPAKKSLFWLLCVLKGCWRLPKTFFENFKISDFISKKSVIFDLTLTASSRFCSGWNIVLMAFKDTQSMEVCYDKVKFLYTRHVRRKSASEKNQNFTT